MAPIRTGERPRQTRSPQPPSRGTSIDVNILLDSGADVDGSVDGGRTALMTAAMFNRTEIVDLLLDRGADIDRRDVTGHTAQMAAQIMNAPDTPSSLPAPPNEGRLRLPTNSSH